uniref:PNPLA domain-containing protein n=1 Tax=viral metagenome TaxID=1070528 RepID=A0A6C0D4B5_9ZZZZ
MNIALFIFMVFIGFRNTILSKMPPSIGRAIKQKTHKFIENQYIQTLHNQRIFGETEKESFLKENPFIKDKRIISISPAGLKGFYVTGICKYIKRRYNLNNYIFSGASAGAWNSLLLCYRDDIEEIENRVIDQRIQSAKSIYDLQHSIKYRLLDNFKTEDFDLGRLFIGVTVMNEYSSVNTTIFHGFDNLEDAINCCIASSHIPLVTGGLTNVYRSMLSFDGGFSRYPYLNMSRSHLHITSDIWRKNESMNSHDNPSIYSDFLVNGENLNNEIAKIHTATRNTIRALDYARFLSKGKSIFNELSEEGYIDSNANRAWLDEVFRV